MSKAEIGVLGPPSELLERNDAFMACRGRNKRLLVLACFCYRHMTVFTTELGSSTTDRALTPLSLEGSGGEAEVRATGVPPISCELGSSVPG